jgi:hypothetical protein
MVVARLALTEGWVFEALFPTLNVDLVAHVPPVPRWEEMPYRFPEGTNQFVDLHAAFRRGRSRNVE